eukprot:4215354-Pleurochrysis_carterae.AAC.1
MSGGDVKLFLESGSVRHPEVNSRVETGALNASPCQVIMLSVQREPMRAVSIVRRWEVRQTSMKGSGRQRARVTSGRVEVQRDAR